MIEVLAVQAPTPDPTVTVQVKVCEPKGTFSAVVEAEEALPKIIAPVGEVHAPVPTFGIVLAEILNVLLLQLGEEDDAVTLGKILFVNVTKVILEDVAAQLPLVTVQVAVAVVPAVTPEIAKGFAVEVAGEPPVTVQTPVPTVGLVAVTVNRGLSHFT